MKGHALSVQCRVPGVKIAVKRWLNRREEMGMTGDLFAGIAVRDRNVAQAWFEQLLGKAPAFFPDETEAVWEIGEHRWLYINVRPEAAGHGMALVFVAEFGAILAEIEER